MKTIYLAGPMTGMPGWNFRAFFMADAMLTMKGYVVNNPARADLTMGSMTWNQEMQDFDVSDTPKADYLRRDLKLVMRSHAIALLPGWENSEGVRHELYVAQKVLGMPVYLYDPEIEDLLPFQPSDTAYATVVPFPEATDGEA